MRPCTCSCIIRVPLRPFRERLLLRTLGPGPFWDLHMFYLLRPILFPNLSLFFRTMHFEHPSALFWFCFLPLLMYHCWWTSCPQWYLLGSNFIRMTKKVNLKVAETSPTMIRFQTGMYPETYVFIRFITIYRYPLQFIVTPGNEWPDNNKYNRIIKLIIIHL